MSDASVSPDPMERACSLVGRFLYHFARIEQKIDQAIIKLLDLDDRAAPVVTGSIDFFKKVNLVRTSANQQAGNDTDKEFAKETCNRVSTVNNARQIVAHSAFEPAPGGGVQFKRTVSKDGRVQILDPHWDEAKFGREYAAMHELESRLDGLIQRIRPTEIPFGWSVNFQDVYHRSSSAGRHAAATAGGNWPPNTNES
jgi:hypothetical protein